MKKIFISFFSFFALFLSCDRIISPLRDLQITKHIVQEYFVTSITFDSKGTAWIGTFKQGLIKYDGSTTNYNSQNTSLPDSIIINDLDVDKNDNVWLGTNKGLISFENHIFKIYNKSNAPLMTDNVYKLVFDKDNILWFTSCVFKEGGVIKYDGNNWTLYSPLNSQLPASLINDISVDKKNNVWIAMSEVVNNGSLAKINSDNWTIYGKEEIGFAPYFVWRIVNDNEGHIHASINYMLSSTFDISRPNVISFDGKSWKINNPVNEKGNSLGYVGEIAVDLNGYLWAETSENGIAVYDGTGWFYDKSKFKVSSGVFDIAVDSHNKIWIGTGNGIYIINNKED